jgi:radical SAM family uncharacterized protein
MELTPQDIEIKLDKILLRTEKPGRYVGGEYNQVIKNWDSISTRVCLVFPDLYDLGISNLGISILYEMINHRTDSLAERAYSPWLDMEELMRRDQIPLYSLESKHPLSQFDIIGITLPYETLYTNTLNILDLAGIPIKSVDRDNRTPLIIAGGHACYNPEPMAEFIDAFIIGEGEEVIHDVITVFQDWKNSGNDRPFLLKSLSAIEGVYVPSLYQVGYHPSGTISSFAPQSSEIPAIIKKRIVAKLPPSPTHLLVPNIDVVHNRVSIEIMRGCTRGCRFCHAGMINRPVRERPVREIIDGIKTSLDQTGYEEIALLSLSSSDYTHIDELVQTITEEFQGQNLKISLPSLRIESFSIDLMEKLRDSRSGGFTLAPEAASEKMRNIINKPISSEQLINTTREIYARGWVTIKLYFMIGLPFETMEDIQAIADLCKQVIYEGHKVKGKRINLHVGISTFVPKTHTPFQWVGSDTIEQIQSKLSFLRSELRVPGIKPSWTDPHSTMLESWLSRGDRKLGSVIYQAWKKGAKFDAWQDQFNYNTWLEAFNDCQISPEFYNHRVKDLDEILPWDHISSGVKKNFLKKDYQASLDQKQRPDCREQCYSCGILTDYGMQRDLNQLEWMCP